MLEYIILGFLMCGEMSGYDIKQYMSHSTAYFYDASFGSIYPMLKKLAGMGWITVREIVENGKYKKLYAISEQGRGAFMAWLNQPVTLKNTKEDHLVRFFFYRYLPKEKAVALITDFIGYVEDITKSLQMLQGKVQQCAGVFEMATLDFGHDYYRFLADWCRRFIEKLKKMGDNEK